MQMQDVCSVAKLEYEENVNKYGTEKRVGFILPACGMLTQDNDM